MERPVSTGCAPWGSRKAAILDLVSDGHGDRDIARQLDIRPEQVSTTRLRAGIPCTNPGKVGAKRSARGDAMAIAWESCRNYTLVAKAFAAHPTTVFEAVQRRVGT